MVPIQQGDVSYNEPFASFDDIAHMQWDIGVVRPGRHSLRCQPLAISVFNVCFAQWPVIKVFEQASMRQREDGLFCQSRRLIGRLVKSVILTLRCIHGPKAHCIDRVRLLAKLV